MERAIKLFVAFSLIVVVAHYAIPAAQLFVKDSPKLFRFLAGMGIAVEIPLK